MHILWAPQTVIDKSNTHNPYKIMGCFDFTNRHKDLTPPNNYSHTKKKQRQIDTERERERERGVHGLFSNPHLTKSTLRLQFTNPTTNVPKPPRRLPK